MTERVRESILYLIVGAAVVLVSMAFAIWYGHSHPPPGW